MSYFISGVDEVGRGALAGPILAVATLFRCPNVVDWEIEKSPIRGVKDSKKFSNKERMEAVYHDILKSPELIDFGIGIGEVDEINTIGINPANQRAFIRAVKDLSQEPDWIIVDGPGHIQSIEMKRQMCMPKADALCWPVAAASIIAKVIRDQLMREIGTEFPHYGWDGNAGYGSKHHQETLRRFGSCRHHRTDFIKKMMGATT